MESDIGSAQTTTPSGETGTADLRDAQEGHGKGRVADAAGVQTIDSDHGQPKTGPLEDAPTADDPFGTPAPSHAVIDEEGPSYERDQGTADPSTGGSSDPNNTLTHANSGDETE